MAKKSATAAERRHMSRVAALGCILPDCGQAADIHHIREGAGMSQRSSHYLTIPLCKEHHQGSFSIHGSPRQFTNIYGSELDLLAATIQQLSE